MVCSGLPLERIPFPKKPWNENYTKKNVFALNQWCFPFLFTGEMAKKSIKLTLRDPQVPNFQSLCFSPASKAEFQIKFGSWRVNDTAASLHIHKYIWQPPRGPAHRLSCAERAKQGARLGRGVFIEDASLTLKDPRVPNRDDIQSLCFSPASKAEFVK